MLTNLDMHLFFFHFIPANYEIGRSSAGELKPLHKLLYGREGRVCFAYQYACLYFILWLFVSFLFCFHFCVTFAGIAYLTSQQGFRVLYSAGSGYCVVFLDETLVGHSGLSQGFTLHVQKI